MNQHHTPSINTRWLIRAAQQRGIGVSELAKVLETPPDDERGWDSLPVGSYITLLNWLSERVAEPDLGMRLGDEVDLSDFGGGAMMLYHAANLRDCCHSLAQYDQSMSAALEIDFHEDDRGGKLEYTLRGPFGSDIRHDSELTIVMLVHFVRQHLGQAWCPVRVDFPYSAPVLSDDYPLLFGDAVYFDQPVTAIYFTRRELNASVTSADPNLLEVIRHHAEALQQRVVQQSNILPKVRHYIARTIGSEYCTAVDAANCLFMSRRNLTRLLQLQGTSFRAMRNDIILEMARKALRETGSSISEIAAQLGYSESSAFDRAFKNGVGCSPTRYRAQGQQPLQ